ncbi:MAG: hypothetical protein R2880_20215 [Deinococcales bacterium]
MATLPNKDLLAPELRPNTHLLTHDIKSEDDLATEVEDFFR